MGPESLLRAERRPGSVRRGTCQRVLGREPDRCPEDASWGEPGSGPSVGCCSNSVHHESHVEGGGPEGGSLLPQGARSLGCTRVCACVTSEEPENRVFGGTGPGPLPDLVWALFPAPRDFSEVLSVLNVPAHQQPWMIPARCPTRSFKTNRKYAPEHLN